MAVFCSSYLSVNLLSYWSFGGRRQNGTQGGTSYPRTLRKRIAVLLRSQPVIGWKIN